MWPRPAALILQPNAMRMQRSSPKISAHGRRTFGTDTSPQTSHWTTRSLVQPLGASHPSLEGGCTQPSGTRSKPHPLGEEHSLSSQHTARAPSVVVLSQSSPGRLWGGSLGCISPPGADVIYEVQVTLGSSEHLFCRGPGGALLTWEEFILTARNRGRLAQHILSLGAVNCWNSLLPFGMLQRGEEGL